MRNTAITGIGRALPERVVTNHELAERLGVDEHWIESRTGIRERHVAGAGESTSSLAAAAAREAIAHSGHTADDIDLVIVGTATPDYLFPSTACLVQNALGAQNAGAFDLQAACSGFIYGLSVASSMIASGAINRAVVAGAEVLTRFLDLEDPVTAPLFGDGAGAVVIEAADEAEPMEFLLGADGAGGPNVILPAGGSTNPATRETVDAGKHFIHMAGRDVFKNAVRRMSEAGAKLGAKGFDILIAHQANARILVETAEKLGVDMEKVFLNIDKTGNTSAASIPVAMHDAWTIGRLDKGNRLLLLAFGAGYTWAGARLTWRITSPVATAEKELTQAR
jgi:3-oxoacyl-[acyl-carrier-protein] synthase-3